MTVESANSKKMQPWWLNEIEWMWSVRDWYLQTSMTKKLSDAIREDCVIQKTWLLTLYFVFAELRCDYIREPSWKIEGTHKRPRTQIKKSNPNRWMQAAFYRKREG